MKDWTLYIRDNKDLRSSWVLLHFMELTAKQAKAQGMNTAKCDEYINDLKQAIREYNHRKTDRRIITGDYDGYIELITLPECFDTSLSEKEVAEWFDKNELLICTPSMYDCTGQAFTIWYKAVKRGGKWFVYHKVGFDV